MSSLLGSDCYGYGGAWHLNVEETSLDPMCPYLELASTPLWYEYGVRAGEYCDVKEIDRWFYMGLMEDEDALCNYVCACITHYGVSRPFTYGDTHPLYFTYD